MSYKQKKDSQPSISTCGTYSLLQPRRKAHLPKLASVVPLPYISNVNRIVRSQALVSASSKSHRLTESGSGQVERNRESEGPQEDRRDKDRVSLEEGVVEDLRSGTMSRERG